MMHGRDLNQPRFSTEKLAAGRSLLDTIADNAAPIAERCLRHLVIATAELRKLDPRLVCDSDDSLALSDTVRFLVSGELPADSERRNVATVLAAIYVGAATAIDRGERPFDATLTLLNHRYTENINFISATNAFDFAFQLRSADFTPAELATTFAHEAAATLNSPDPELALIAFFLAGFSKDLRRDGERSA